MRSLKKPLESRSEAHVDFSDAQCAPSLAATLRNPFLLDFRSSWTKIGDVSRLTTRKKATRQAVCCELGFLIRADWEKLAGSHLDSHIAVLCPRRRFLKEKAGTRPAFSLRPRGQGHITLLPTATVGRAFEGRLGDHAPSTRKMLHSHRQLALPLGG